MSTATKWITNGPDADTIDLCEDRPDAASRGITAFIVERDTQDFLAHPNSTSSECAVQTRVVVFESCEVPAENVLGREGGGVGVLMSGLDFERVVYPAGRGIMQAWTSLCRMSTSENSSVNLAPFN